jgi:tripartite-type tricarboxylate transporter receptor subunit TctC
MIDRRQWLALGVGVGAAAALHTRVHAQTLGMARLLIGAPAGGAGDTLLRRVADRMKGRYAGNVIVENKAGAGGQIALMAAREAAADGATMLMTPSTFFSLYPHTYRKLPYDAERDFAPVSLMAYTNFGLAVGPAVPESVRTLEDFMAWSRANPEKATYGSPAPGSVPHLIVAAAARQFDAPLKHVPYKGSVPGLQDMRGGHLAAMSSPIGALVPHVQQGGARVLAVSGSARSPQLPQTPTYREQGMPIVGREWFGMFLPGKASPELVSHAAAQLREALQHKDTLDTAARLGLDIAWSSPQELRDMIRADSEEWQVWVRKIGFTAES